MPYFMNLIISFALVLVFQSFSWTIIFLDISEVDFSKRMIAKLITTYVIGVYLLIFISNVGLLGLCIYPVITFIFQYKKNYRTKSSLFVKLFNSFYSFNIGFLMFWLYNSLVKILFTSFWYHPNESILAPIIVISGGILTIITHKWIIWVNPIDVYLKEKLLASNIKLVDCILLIIYICELSFYFYTANNAEIIGYVRYIVLLFTFIFITIFIFSTFKSQLAAKEEINQLQKTQLDNLAVYTEEIEKMYQTLRGFRHDYQNVLLSLQESIDSEDIEQIKQVYQETLASADVRLVRQIEATNVNELANIHDSAVKSVMFWKITQARDRKVAVDVEIKEEISQLWMSSLHFIRIFSILMDNAIEEAKRTVTPKISIALFVNQGDIIFIVSNSTLLTSVNINQLKKPGYTTKGKNRGIGLSNVDEILTQYSNCYLETELENGVFTQRLVMEGIEE